MPTSNYLGIANGRITECNNNAMTRGLYELNKLSKLQGSTSVPRKGLCWRVLIKVYL